MPVVRAPEPNENFTKIPNETLRDTRLSFRALGVLAEILSHTPDWCPNSVEMARRGKEGRDAIRKAFSELEAAGYLVRVKTHSADGTWVTRLKAFAYPQVAPTTDFQAPVNPSSVRPGQTGVSAGRTDDGFSGVGGDGRSRRSRTSAQVAPTTADQASENQALYERLDTKDEGLSSSSRIADRVGDDAQASPSGTLDLVGAQREDVERLCLRLADAIEANGSKRPEIKQGWRDAARLLMDKDGRTEDQIAKAIDWCQEDEFWRCNILSMPTLRKQYDKLRLSAMRGRGNSVNGAPKSTTDERVQQGLELAAKFRERRLAQEALTNAKEITQ